MNCVTPNLLEILDGPGGDTMQPEVDMMSVVNSIVEKCSTQPEEVISCQFVIINFHMIRSAHISCGLTGKKDDLSLD